MNSRLTLTIGGVLLVAATVAGCGGGGMGNSYSSPSSPNPAATPPASSPSSPGAVTITILGMSGSNSYSPNPATVKVGQTVAWRNADSLPHTATADGSAFDTGTLAAGATSSPITMNVAGSFPYHCTIHGLTMVGTLTVTQ
jgi:plastocyanin